MSSSALESSIDTTLTRPPADKRERYTPSVLGRPSTISERNAISGTSNSVALVARVVATTNRPAQELFAVRPTVTLYRIHVRQFASGARSWCVLRRYSEFVDLAAALSRTVGTMPALPPKLVVNTPEGLANRYLELDAFLRSLLSMPLAAGHARLRSFLGADAAWSPVLGDVDPGAIVEDDWDHEAEAGEGGDVTPLPTSAGRASGSGIAEVGPVWLLSGSWTADEARCRDSIEPLLRAMGTPQSVRKALRGDRVVSRITHSPGVKLVEVTLSALGEGRPTTYELDGRRHPMWMGTREAVVRAVELRRTGAVRVEYTLPDAMGSIYDTRRVINGGEEMVRIIELHMNKEPPLRLHRLMVRTGPQLPPALRPELSRAASLPRLSDSVNVNETDAAGSEKIYSVRLPGLRSQASAPNGNGASAPNGNGASAPNGSGASYGQGHHTTGAAALGASASGSGVASRSGSGGLAGGSVAAGSRPLTRALTAMCVTPGRWAFSLVEAATTAPATALSVVSWLFLHALWLLVWLRAGVSSEEDAAATVRQLNLMLYWSPEVSTEAALSAEASTVVWTARALHVLLTLDAVAMMWLLVHEGPHHVRCERDREIAS